MLFSHAEARGGSSVSVKEGEGGLKVDKKIFYCKGVEGPAPGEIFDFQRLAHAISWALFLT